MLSRFIRPGRNTLLAVATILLAAGGSIASAQEIDNPIYQSWASHKPDTNVVLQMSASAEGQTMKMTFTSKLVEVTPDKVTVETSQKMDMMGMTQNMGPTRKDIKAKISAAENNAGAPPDFQGTVKQVGTETVTIAGKSYNCNVSEFSGTSRGGKVTGKTWFCAEVPDGLVKINMKPEGGPMGDMNFELIEVNLKD